jgi:ribonuclease PH
LTYSRADGRALNEPRPVSIEIGFQPYAEGSALIKTGNTHVICSASVGEGVPGWRRSSGLGWVTAEYGMLPRSTHTRTGREARQGRQGGRSLEIQRLIGRSLRAVTDMEKLGQRTVTIDCDVIRADGGTRTAAITGAYVALYLATQQLIEQGKIESSPLNEPVAATSLGYVSGDLCLDLAYDEDSAADVDFNVVMTGSDQFVEIQGTAEGRTFDRTQFDSLLDLAKLGIESMLAAQQKALADHTK